MIDIAGGIVLAALALWVGVPVIVWVIGFTVTCVCAALRAIIVVPCVIAGSIVDFLGRRSR